MDGGLPTDGKAELRMNTFEACGFETKIVNVRSRSFDCEEAASGQRSFLPQFDIAIRCHDGCDNPNGTKVQASRPLCVKKTKSNSRLLLFLREGNFGQILGQRRR
jgi:hypothetical protein